jgi:CheY-like chemotaxis protein
VAEFRVLLVDDEEELVSALAERLGYRDIQAQYVTSGLDALEKLKSSEFDVIVIDLKLPCMSGEELARTIRQSYPCLPVLMITGHGVDESGEHRKPAGVYELLPKPVDIEELVRKMREAIEAK